MHPYHRLGIRFGVCRDPCFVDMKGPEVVGAIVEIPIM